MENFLRSENFEVPFMKLWDRFDKLNPGIKRCILATVLVTAYFQIYTKPPIGFIPLFIVVALGATCAYQLDRFITKLWRGE